MTGRRWQDLSSDPTDISAHLAIARNHPRTDAGRASTRILFGHYRAACSREMEMHHRLVSGQVPADLFKVAQVDGMLEDFANWLKRKVFLSDDPVGEVNRLIGSQIQTKNTRKTKKIKKLEKIVF